jgi:hypothetical protein
MTPMTTTHRRPVYKMTDAEVLEEYEAMRLKPNLESHEIRRRQHLFMAVTSVSRPRRRPRVRAAH